MRLAKRRQPHRSSSTATNDDGFDDGAERHPRESFDNDIKQRRQQTERMVRRTGITAMIALLVIAAVASVKGQAAAAAAEACMTRTAPVGVAIEDTAGEGGETKTLLGLLAFFGGSIDAANAAPMPIVVADDKFACKPIGSVRGENSTYTTRVWVLGV
jgi:hypothetical protein